MAKRKATIDTKPLEDEVNKAMPESSEGAEGSSDDDEDEEDEDDEDDEDDSEEGEAEKGGIGALDLNKALDELDTLTKAQSNGVSARTASLAGKLAKGESLTKSEKAELASLAEDDGLEKSHKETFVDDNKLEQGFEVSEFLDAQANVIAKALDDNRAEMRKSFAELGEYNRAFAKVLVAQASEIKDLKAQLAKSEAPVAPRVIEAAPAKGVSSVGRKVNDGMSKSEGGAPVTLSKPQILSTMMDLAKSDKDSGVDWNHAVVMYESTNMLGRPAMLEIAKKRGIDPAAFAG